jgi:hypothetical protein
MQDMFLLPSHHFWPKPTDIIDIPSQLLQHPPESNLLTQMLSAQNSLEDNIENPSEPWT